MKKFIKKVVLSEYFLYFLCGMAAAGAVSWIEIATGVLR